jgi:hypothetical protein
MCKTRRAIFCFTASLEKGEYSPQAACLYWNNVIAAWLFTTTSATKMVILTATSDEENADEEIAVNGSYLRLNGLDPEEYVPIVR